MPSFPAFYIVYQFNLAKQKKGVFSLSRKKKIEIWVFVQFL